MGSVKTPQVEGVDVVLLALREFRIAERVSRPEVVPVVHVEGEGEDAWLPAEFVEQRVGGWTTGAALGREQFNYSDGVGRECRGSQHKRKTEEPMAAHRGIGCGETTVGCRHHGQLACE